MIGSSIATLLDRRLRELDEMASRIVSSVAYGDTLGHAYIDVQPVHER
jgi:hypothetical protein